MSQTKTPNVEPLTYANEQTLPDGTYIAYDVHVEGDHFVCTTTAGREESTEVLAPAESDLFAVLAMKPEVLRVGTGITEITTTEPVSIHRLLGALVVDDPDAEMVEADAWAALASGAGWLGVDVDR